MKKHVIVFCIFSVLIIGFFYQCTQNHTLTDKEIKQQDSLQKVLKNPLLDSINKQLLKNPNNDSLYRERAYVYVSVRQFDIAINDCKRAIKIDSTNTKNHLALADVYFAANKTKLSKDKLEEIVKKFPDNTEAHLKLGELYYLVKQYEKAIEYVNKALKIDPTLAKGYYIKGNVYKESGDTNKAISSFQTAIEQDPKMIDAFIDLGVIYAARNNSLAIQYYNNALKLDPKNNIALYDKAFFYQQIGMADSAVALYHHILNLYPHSPHVLYNLGAIEFAMRKNKDKAIEYFTKAIQQKPDYAEAYYARAIVKKEQNKKQEAITDLKECLKYKVNFEPAIAELNQLEGK
ncbi:MAG: tetratricopeptide repeat protein [Bacteroidetes bacterium]|jgi:tetratricopeptide (TPR) repeat protein|nr:MAG: tetratricopeptide repeat protein [Bacteroidota bacterium]